jgi:hypothetical protein
MSKDLHEKPFDETTIAKLEIFEDYAQAWLPTFIRWGEREVYIFDFYAGTGYDINSAWGEDGVKRSKKANRRVFLGKKWNE